MALSSGNTPSTVHGPVGGVGSKKAKSTRPGSGSKTSYFVAPKGSKSKGGRKK